MKFLCDRCKTRYSIGDDRVRGKILKIRCKNCANVITVREGMDADGSDLPARAKKPTTMAPMPVDAGAPAAGNSALGQAFASAMTKPPPALEEEWYVSIDGEQSGPFSLSEAQRWVAAKPIDADLHCWSEGFDDWLPVDKVSHFRNLRKKPTAPPPLPRVGGGTSPAPARTGTAAAAAAPKEDEPKPLFAATMASLEKASTPVDTARGVGLGNGTGAATPVSARGGAPAKPVVPNGTRQNGVSGPAGKSPVKPLFDTADIGESTTIEPGPFNEEALTAHEPVASAAKQQRSTGSHDAATTTPHMSSAGTSSSMPSLGSSSSGPQLFGGSSSPTAPKFGGGAPGGTVPLSALANGPGSAPQPSPSGHGPSAPPLDDAAPEDDGLDIGEVSRVVKLADIVRGPSKPRGPSGNNAAMRRSNPALGTAAGVARMTGPAPRIAGTGPAPAITNPGVSPEQLIGADGLPVPLPLGGEDLPAEQHAVANPTVSHKRGMIALIAGAVGLIAILLVVVIVVTNSEDDYIPQIVAQYTGIDTTGREIIIQVQEDGKEVAIDKATGKQVDPRTVQKRPTNTTPTPPPRPPEPTGDPLSSSDIESMATRYNTQSATCWRRSRKGTEDILISDVKKITIYLTVAKDGSVSSVTQKGLPGGTKLEACLSSMIRGWKFRANAGGTFGFTMLPPG